jgi:hypothetical protein
MSPPSQAEPLGDSAAGLVVFERGISQSMLGATKKNEREKEKEKERLCLIW